MTFAQPLWILVGLLVCCGVILLFRTLEKRRMETLEKFAASHLLDRLTRNVSPRRQTAKKVLFALALFCCFLALARPQYGFRWEDVKRKGIDILFAIDTSKSMLTEDVKPNRLERAKYAIMDFVGQLDGDRVGLLPFAGSAYLMCPLTGDYSAFDETLQAVNTATIPKGGTNIPAAIREAENVLTNEANYKLLILITDGENLQGDVMAAADEAAKKGLRIFTVGVGTREGEIIPISAGSSKGFVKDSSGNYVVSHLDETTLTQIAKKSDGLYVPLGKTGQGLETIYQKKLALVPKKELTERRRKVPLERFPWPLSAAIVFLVLDFAIGTRKTQPLRLPFGGNGRMLGSLLLLVSVSLIGRPALSHGSEGETAYAEKDYKKAEQVYENLLKKHPDDPKILFDSGTASYKNRKYDEAVSAFTGALRSRDLDLQQQAYYNRGNAYYKKGEETLTTDSDQTLSQWNQAVESYSASLELKPDDKDALYNRDLVKKKIEELKKQESKKQKQQNEDKGSDKNRKDSQDNKQNGRQDDERNKQNGSQQKSPEQQNGQQNRNTDTGQAPEQKSEPPQRQNPQDSSGRDQNRRNQPQPAGAQTQQAQKNADSKADTALDNERRKQGKMTREDAEQLLNSLKNEEGKLNFIPDRNNNSEDETRRDW